MRTFEMEAPLAWLKKLIFFPAIHTVHPGFMSGKIETSIGKKTIANGNMQQSLLVAKLPGMIEKLCGQEVKEISASRLYEYKINGNIN